MSKLVSAMAILSFLISLLFCSIGISHNLIEQNANWLAAWLFLYALNLASLSAKLVQLVIIELKKERK